MITVFRFKIFLIISCISIIFNSRDLYYPHGTLIASPTLSFLKSLHLGNMYAKIYHFNMDLYFFIYKTLGIVRYKHFYKRSILNINAWVFFFSCAYYNMMWKKSFIMHIKHNMIIKIISTRKITKTLVFSWLNSNVCTMQPYCFILGLWSDLFGLNFFKKLKENLRL